LKEEALQKAAVSEQSKRAMPGINMNVFSAASVYRDSPAAASATEGAPGTAITVHQATAPPKKVRKVALGSGNLGLRDKPVTADVAHQMVVDDTHAREQKEAEKVAQQHDRATKKKETQATMVAQGVQLKPKLDAAIKACTTRRKLEPEALLAKLNSKEFSANELKALIAAKMHTPTTKGGKAGLAQQLRGMLAGGPPPLLLTN
jgi:hypothetical protein